MVNRADFLDQPRPSCPDGKSPGQLDGSNFWQPTYYRLGDNGHSINRGHGNNRGGRAKTPSEQIFVTLHNNNMHIYKRQPANTVSRNYRDTVFAGYLLQTSRTGPHSWC